jgi:hypothetical protein
MVYALMVGMVQISSWSLAWNCIGAFVVASVIYRYPLVVAKSPRIQQRFEYVRVGVAVVLVLAGIGALAQLIFQVA